MLILALFLFPPFTVCDCMSCINAFDRVASHTLVSSHGGDILLDGRPCPFPSPFLLVLPDHLAAHERSAGGGLLCFLRLPQSFCGAVTA